MATETIEIIKGNDTIVFYPNSHRYKVKGEKTYLLSPSSIVGMLDKSGPLLIWATRLTVDYVKNYIAQKGIVEMPTDQVLELIEIAASQHTVKKDEAADVGTLIHDYAEAFAKFKLGMTARPEVPDVHTMFPANSEEANDLMQAQVENGIKAFLTWVKDHKVEYLHSEYFVYNPEIGYAGRTDAIAMVDGELTILDYKTGKSIYSSHRYQAAGYYLAVQHDGIHPTRSAILLFNKEDGSFKYESYEEDEINKDAEVFLALAKVKEREKLLSKW
jgi:hypothetical protein